MCLLWTPFHFSWGDITLVLSVRTDTLIPTYQMQFNLSQINYVFYSGVRFLFVRAGPGRLIWVLLHSDESTKGSKMVLMLLICCGFFPSQYSLLYTRLTVVLVLLPEETAYISETSFNQCSANPGSRWSCPFLCCDLYLCKRTETWEAGLACHILAELVYPIYQQRESPC